MYTTYTKLQHVETTVIICILQMGKYPTSKEKDHVGMRNHSEFGNNGE